MADQSTQTLIPSERLNNVQFGKFLEAALDYKDKADWKGDKRFYLTLLPNIANVEFGNIDNRSEVINYNIRTKLSGSYDIEGGAKITSNLAELSTAEIISIERDVHSLTIDSKFPLNQQYVAREHNNGTTADGSSTSAVAGTGDNHAHKQTPASFMSGSFLISKVNDDNPSLLVELNKQQQLPNGLGDKEFIVIPDNLHPFIKDNIEYFLTRAGINVSGDASRYIALDETNRNLP
jgi:hypothetical protein